MYILALETTGKYGSAAVINENGDSFFCATNNEMNHLSELILAADNVINQTGITKKDLTHIACSIGPGSFTGIRIGITTARTLAQMLNVPCIEVSSLKGMAENVKIDAISQNCKYIASIINARRGQIYAGLWMLSNVANTNEDRKVLESKYDSNDFKLEIVIPESQYMMEDFAQYIVNRDEKVYITGDGIDAYEEIIEDKIPSDLYELAPEKMRYQTADSIARIALKKARANEVLSYQELLPKYFRLAEAEQKLKEKRELLSRASSNKVVINNELIDNTKNDSNAVFDCGDMFVKSSIKILQNTEDWKKFTISANLNDTSIAELKFTRVLDEIQIENIEVSEQYRRKNIATKMIEKLVETAKNLECEVIQLEVRMGNEAARSLYEKVGFMEVGTRKEYYQDTGEDAILMDYKI